ncbi:MAG: leucine-rich repeat protein [Clostridiales bacterium]|nr:leucine-rich repeat protein [Clostridiales bacterium]
MYKKRISLLLIISLLFTCLLGNINVLAASASLTISTSGSASVGDTVTVDINFSSADIAGGKFELAYDNTILKAVSGETGSSLTTKNITGYPNPEYSSSTCFFTFANAEDISVNGVIATFTFTAISEGTAAFSISSCKFADSDANIITMTTGKASVVIADSSSSSTTTETTTESTTETTTETTTEATTASPTVSESDFKFNSSTGTITGYKGTATNVVIPSSIGGVAVKAIGNYAFQDIDVDLVSLTIPEGVESIGTAAFAFLWYLESVTLPESLKTIGDSAFLYCSSLTEISIPSGVTSIEHRAFGNCEALEGIEVSNNNQYYTSVDNVLFDKDVTTIIVYAAKKTGTTYSIPDSVTTIGEYAFYSSNNLTNITIPSNVESIGSDAFFVCGNLKSITILNKTVSIGSKAFDIAALSTIYCYKGSTADDSSLYNDWVEIVYLDDSSGTDSVAAPSFKVVGVFGGRSVTFTSETDGAVIYYSSSTSNITTDDIMVENGGTVTYEDYYGTIYARAYYNGVWSDVNKFVLKIPVVNTPTVTASGSTVTIKSTTPSSFICYTTDGTEPVIKTDGTVTNGTWLRVNGARTNSGTITATPGDTVRAVAVRNCFTTSASAAAYINVSPAAFKVVGTFGGRNVTFTSDTSGAKIYYSSTTSSLTTSDKCVSNGETVLFEDFYGTIYARAYYNGKWSNVSRLILKIPTINDPTITYSGGKATIRTTTPSCYIYYTTDGTTPSITNGKKLCSNSYGQVTVSRGTTIKAIAVRSCFTNSEIVSYTVS